MGRNYTGEPMKLNLTDFEIDLIVGSLYFANCRLGQFNMAGGKHKEQALELIQLINKEKENAE
jgi:hypothetical protein